MLEKPCPKCEQTMRELDGQMVLLHGTDVPAFGSRCEIMVTPKKTVRVRVYRCTNPACGYLEFYSA